MVDLYSIGASILLLAILLAVLPFRLTVIGKVAIFICSVIIGVVLYLGYSHFQLSLLFPIVLLLTALMSYMVFNRVPLFRDDRESSKNISRLEPLFSFEELKEKAEKAETVDHYYSEFPKLVEGETVESPAMGQDAIDKLLQQYEESVVGDEKDAIVKEEEQPPVIEHEELDFDLPLEREEIVNAEPIHQEEAQWDFIEEEVFDRSSLLDEIEESEAIDRRIEDYREIDDSDLIDEEYDLIEIRKKLFAELEESTTMDEKDSEEQAEKKKQEENHFSSEELDDLEELYLQRKKWKNEGVEE